ncbi:hypothetical protein CR513_12443, partial [Mucuna pruriens]
MECSLKRPQRRGHIASQCPNKRTMILKDDGKIVSESSQDKYLLMVRRLMSAFIKDDSQRENIFHSHGKREVAVSMLPVLVKLTLVEYKDEILCNVVPMEATHILLGRTWQFDRKVTHDGVTNTFSFKHKGKKVTLKPLSLLEVPEDQIKMKQKRDEEKIEKLEKIQKEIKIKNEKSKEVKKEKNEIMQVNRKVVKKVLLNNNKSLLLWLTNMCLFFRGCLTSLRVFFKRFQKDCHLFEESNIKLILYPILYCIIDLNIERIPRNPKRLKNK